MLGAVFLHHIGQLVVHVILDTDSRCFLGWGFFTNNLRFDRASSRERAHHGLGLELDQRLGQHRVVHTASAFPWLTALLDLHAKQLKSIDISLHPVLATGNVFLILAHQIAGQRLQVLLGHLFGQVGVEIFLVFALLDAQNRLAVNPDLYGLRVLDLNLDLW